MTTELKRTICVLDCPDACGLEVAVEDGRVTAIRGHRDHPDTAGFICAKVSRFHHRLDHPTRLRQPMRRVGPKGSGEFVPLSWEGAIAEITETFQEVKRRWGGEAILGFHYGGSNGMLTDGLLDDLYFARWGASRLAKTICAAVVTAVATEMYGKMAGVAFADYPRAQAIVVWGANPRASNIHLVPYLREAKRRGAFLAVVDPRRTLPAADVDLHLPVRPGTDLPVALALVRLAEERGLLDRDFLARWAVPDGGLEALLAAARPWTIRRAAAEAGVEPGALLRLADVYFAARPALLRIGWGLERNRNGGQAVAALLALPALLGKFGVAGGGYTLSNSGALNLRREEVVGEVTWTTRALNMTRLGEILTGDPHLMLDPPVKALFVYNANPAATVPDQNRVLAGLAREDLFTVVFEQVMTDTARWADILLPATTFLEGWDLHRGYGSYVVGGAPPVVPPVGEARNNLEAFAVLGRAARFPDPAFRRTPRELFERAARALDFPGGPVDPDALLAGGIAGYDFPGARPVQFETAFPRTPDGKVHLTPAALGSYPYRYLAPSDRYPLALITPASPRLISSTLGELHVDELLVTLHPADAAARGITGGDRVRAYNELGEVICRAEVSDAVRPGVVAMPKGAWRRSSGNGATSTALCPSHVNVVAGGACFNDARVELAKM